MSDPADTAPFNVRDGHAEVYATDDGTVKATADRRPVSGFVTVTLLAEDGVAFADLTVYPAVTVAELMVNLDPKIGGGPAFLFEVADRLLPAIRAASDGGLPRSPNPEGEIVLWPDPSD
jgi:hypothetical protein